MNIVVVYQRASWCNIFYLDSFGDKHVLVSFQMLVTLLRPLVSWIPPLLTAALIGVMYQLLLSLAGLREYLIFGPLGDYSRPTLVSANREGIVSCLGYLSLYYSGVQMGTFLFRVKE